MVYKCDLCDGEMETDDVMSGEDTIVCPHCGINTRLIPVRPFNKPPIKPAQVVPPSILSGDSIENVPAQPRSIADLGKAEQLHLQATFRLHECQAHYKVYGSRLGKPANDGLEFVEAALRLFPDNPKYLNTKALLLADGLGEMNGGMEILRQALRIAPDDIQIRQNLRDVNAALDNSRMLNVIAIIVVVLLGVGLVIFVLNNN